MDSFLPVLVSMVSFLLGFFGSKWGHNKEIAELKNQMRLLKESSIAAISRLEGQLKQQRKNSAKELNKTIIRLEARMQKNNRAKDFKIRELEQTISQQNEKIKNLETESNEKKYTQGDILDLYHLFYHENKVRFRF